MKPAEFYAWASPILDFLASVAWVLFAIVVLAVFRKPLAALMTKVEEFELWGVKGRTRRGNERAAELESEASSDDANPLDSVGEATTNDDTRAEQDEMPVVVNSVGLAQSPLEVLNFYERIVADRLTRSTYNTGTTSSKLGAEIVGNSYADLKQSLRVLHFLEFGIGQRGRLRSTTRMLDDFELPAELKRDILKARKFAIDVHEGRERVDGEGAEAYINATIALVNRLCAWARPIVSKSGDAVQGSALVLVDSLT